MKGVVGFGDPTGELEYNGYDLLLSTVLIFGVGAGAFGVLVRDLLNLTCKPRGGGLADRSLSKPLGGRSTWTGESDKELVEDGEIILEDDEGELVNADCSFTLSSSQTGWDC